MLCLPASFLPFDPTHDYDKSEESDNQLSSESDEQNDDTLVDDHMPDSISNGDNNHERRQNHHNGGGVVLVSLFLLKVKNYSNYFKWLNRVQPVNVSLLLC